MGLRVLNGARRISSILQTRGFLAGPDSSCLSWRLQSSSPGARAGSFQAASESSCCHAAEKTDRKYCHQPRRESLNSHFRFLNKYFHLQSAERSSGPLQASHRSRHFVTAAARAASAHAPLGVNISDSHSVYFAGYVVASEGDEAEFQQIWEDAVAHTRQQKGFRYQELAKQEPGMVQQLQQELQQGEGEGQHPFSFIEYTVFDSLKALQATTGSEDWSRARERLAKYAPPGGASAGGPYSISIRVARSQPQEGEVVLVNLLEVASEPTANLVETISWPKRVEFQSSQPGFLTATLHRSLEASAQWKLVNRSEWSSLEALLASEKRMRGAFPVAPPERASELHYFPGLFRVVRSFSPPAP
eukprot:jgi/Mesen1/9422/ME000618S08822